MFMDAKHSNLVTKITAFSVISCSCHVCWLLADSVMIAEDTLT